jgi:lipopolysaccharide assembly outer membrane protein LptD (OstA)
VSGPLNTFYSGVGRLPEGWLAVFPQELFEDSGLYYESRSSAGYLAQQWTDDGSFTNAWRPFEPDTVRLHSRQKLTYPLRAFEVVSLVPRLAYDYTFYQHLADDRTNQARSVFELGSEVSTKWYASYGGGYRHVVEPYADYSIVTTPLNVKRGQNYFFDRVDGPRDWSDLFGVDGNYAPVRWNGIRPGVRNTVQRKDADGTVRTIFDWDVFVAYRFGGGGGSQTNDAGGLRATGWNLTWRPDRDVTLRTAGMYDDKGGRLDMSDSSLTIGEERDWTFELGYFTSDPLDPTTLNRPADPQLIGNPYVYDLRASAIARAGITHRFNSYWSANVTARYDTRETQLQEIGGYVQYELDCLAFRLNSSYMPPYDYYNGVRRKPDYRVAMMIWVKALQPDHIEKLRGW